MAKKPSARQEQQTRSHVRTRAFAGGPATLSEDGRSFDVVIYTETPVRTRILDPSGSGNGNDPPQHDPSPAQACGPPAAEETTRRFSKRVTVASLAFMCALAGYGGVTANPYTADIINALGPWVLGLIVTYMAVGYGDHRLSKGLPSLTDLVGMAFALRSGRGFRHGGYPQDGVE